MILGLDRKIIIFFFFSFVKIYVLIFALKKIKFVIENKNND